MPQTKGMVYEFKDQNYSVVSVHDGETAVIPAVVRDDDGLIFVNMHKRRENDLKNPWKPILPMGQNETIVSQPRTILKRTKSAPQLNDSVFQQWTEELQPLHDGEMDPSRLYGSAV